ncbi:MAG TPA: serine/threonine-protein kinase [Candidatus Obscuribacterales bacterium]
MLTEFGQYEVLSEIGRGGMGIVYQALDRTQQRMVAIKQLVLDNVDPTKHREFRDRFRREAAMAARLDHRNIVSVFDVSSDPDKNYYVMEFLDGHSLRKEIEQHGGRLTAAEYLPILQQIAEGLAYAHSLNVVHRDVKPDNIFILKDGTVKLTDFGIARTVDYEQTHLTKTGVMLGTLAYVSPEQLQDAKNVDHRADLFSLGVVSYEALAGRLPFVGEGIAQTVIRILSSEPQPLHMLCPTVSVETAAVISKALRKKARDRYMSVVDFARDFERSLVGRPISISVGEAFQAPAQAAARTSGGQPVVHMPGVPMQQPAGVAEVPAAPQHAAVNMANTRVSSGATYYMVKPLGVIGRQGEGNGCFLEPAVICARSGRIVVGDVQLRRLQIFARDGRWLATITPRKEAKGSQTGGGSLTSPSGIAMDFRGRIYVCDSGDHYVRIFDSQGMFVKELVNLHGKEGGLQGVACDSTGLIYLADPENGCLQVFQSDTGTWLRKVGSKGSKPGQLHLPSGVAVDRMNQVYVVDYSTSRVSVFSKAGIFVRSFGGKGTANGLFNVPRDVAVDNKDRIYVSDSLNHRIQIFGPAGDWLYSFGGRGAEQGKFVGPAGISIDPENNCLYVVDRGNKRIQIFELTGLDT